MTKNIDFPEIKEIRFRRKEFYGEKDKNVKKLIRNSIPIDFLYKRTKIGRSPKKGSVYSPKKIQSGKKGFIARKPKDIQKNLNFEENNDINLDNLEIKNLNIYESKINRGKTKFRIGPNIKKLEFKNSSTNGEIINNDNNFIDQNEYNESKTHNNFYRAKIRDDMGGNVNRRFSKELKGEENINCINAQRSTAPIFRKKINIPSKINIKRNQFGNIRIENDY